MIRAALQSRQPGYREAAELVRRRQRMQEKSRASYWTLALELLRNDWLEPVSDDDVFELFALSTTLSVLADDVGLGKPIQYGLLGSAREPAATFKADGVTVRVYFDRAPSKLLGSTSRYVGVLAAYDGVDGSERRPDILVHAEHDGCATRTFFVEVKNATTASYVRDSIYKLFGYLYDYEDLFDAATGHKAVLYLPEGSIRLRGAEEDGSRIKIICEAERDRFAAALMRGLGLGKTSASTSASVDTPDHL